MRNSYIGVFDSGLGGLTTVRELIRQLPDENIVFLGDTKNMPYGSKQRNEIISFTKNNIKTLMKYDVKAIIIACNTSDSNASDVVRNYFDIPIFGVIKPAVRKALSVSQNRRIGIMATSLTIKSKKYEELIHSYDQDVKVFGIECPLLVPMIEDGEFINNEEKMTDTVREYLKPLQEENIDTLILGCTHYDLLQDIIRKLAPEINIVSSSRCVIDDVKEYLNDNDLTNDAEVTQRKYLCSKDGENFRKIASLIIDDINIEKIEMDT